MHSYTRQKDLSYTLELHPLDYISIFSDLFARGLPSPPPPPLRIPLRKVKVLGPNLDPRFPDCLDDKPEEARRLLRLAYDRALECFWDLMTRSAPIGGKGSSISSHESILNDERLAGGLLPFGKRVTGEDTSTRGGGNETKR